MILCPPHFQKLRGHVPSGSDAPGHNTARTHIEGHRTHTHSTQQCYRKHDSRCIEAFPTRDLLYIGGGLTVKARKFAHCLANAQNRPTLCFLPTVQIHFFTFCVYDIQFFTLYLCFLSEYLTLSMYNLCFFIRYLL